ncbi:MAG: TetR/AcrR family transcriptional regulator [Clostridia bacterium]|nr:TetR/AcrR family transcriptional regulator [Clostridia bacterium]NCC43350.1 TetR/AcrR family transcriptional regulator [Clostridia bacterium]
MSRNKYPEETVTLILNVAEKLFLEKGYDDTSIQDIINGLGGLSKGAVYHHFKSKEDIFNAVGDRYNQPILASMKKVRDNPALTGFEKLKKMFELSLTETDYDIVYNVSPNMLDNPKLLALQIREIFDTVAPLYIQPVIEDGIKDGSIQTEYPRELAEVMILLTNIWINPLVVETDTQTKINRVFFFNSLLKNMGIDLLDEKMLNDFVQFCQIPPRSSE